MATGRSVTVLASLKGIEDLAQVVTAKIRDQGADFRGIVLCQQPREAGVGPSIEAAELGEQQAGLGGPQQALIFFVGHQVDAFAEPFAAGPREDASNFDPYFTSIT
jgi:hypothetical protein